jgi:RNA polymerase sigma-70 factor (ECF subfamily)
VLLHRARRALAGYDARRVPRDASLRERSLEVLGRFMAAFAKQDVPGMEALLAEEIVTLNDTNGRYPAAGVPVVGRNKVARFHAGIARLREGHTPRIEVRQLNGSFAIFVEYGTIPDDNLAPRFAVSGELDRDGRVRRIYSVLAPEKLERLSPSGTGSPASQRRKRRGSRARA